MFLSAGSRVSGLPLYSAIVTVFESAPFLPHSKIHIRPFSTYFLPKAKISSCHTYRVHIRPSFKAELYPASTNLGTCYAAACQATANRAGIVVSAFFPIAQCVLGYGRLFENLRSERQKMKIRARLNPAFISFYEVWHWIQTWIILYLSHPLMCERETE